MAVPPLQQQQGATDVVAMVMNSLRRHWRLVALGGLAGLALAFLFSVLATPRYVARAELLVDPRDLVVFDKEVRPGSATSDMATAVVESQARVLESDNVLRRAVVIAKLEQDPEFNGTRQNVVRRILNALPGFGSGGAAEPADPKLIALRALQLRVDATRPERTYIVRLNVWTDDRLKSVAVADAIIQAYLEDQAAARSDPARQAEGAITAGIEPLRKRVAEAEEKVAKYKTANNLVGVSGRLVNEQQLTELNNQIVVARTDMGRAKVRYEEARRLRGNPEIIPEAVNSATLRQLRTQMVLIADQKAKLSAQLKPQHPQMQSAIAQEKEVGRQITDELRRITKSAQVDYDRAKAVEASLTKNLEGLRTQMNQSTDAQIKLRELESELDANRAIYSAAIARARETKEQSRLNTTNVRVTASPSPPRDSSYPPSRMLLLPAGLLLGMGLGAGLGLLRDMLGGMPQSNAPPAEKESFAPRGSFRRPYASVKSSFTVTPPGGDVAPFPFANLRGLGPRAWGGERSTVRHIVDLGLSVLTNPGSGIGADLSRLAERLDALHETSGKGHRTQVLLIASDERNYMKSAVALGLANAAYAADKRVLLVDADLGDRRLSASMPVTRRDGSAEVMLGAATLSAAVIKRPGSSLEFLPAVVRHGRPRLSGLSSAGLRGLVAQARDYDVVVIELPPLDASYVHETFADSGLKMVLTLKTPLERQDALLDTIKMLRRAVPGIAGLVITD